MGNQKADCSHLPEGYMPLNKEDKMKHTPAPWTQDKEFVYALNNKGSNRFYAGIQTGFDDNNSKTSLEEMIANAKLIAAAPDLLEALILAKTLLIESGHYQEAQNEFNEICNVIAKATS